MTIPFGRRRLILSLDRVSPSPAGRVQEPAEAAGATDFELAHLGHGAMKAEIDRARWHAAGLMLGLRQS
jgi:hypothetical protein